MRGKSELGRIQRKKWDRGKPSQATKDWDEHSEDRERKESYLLKRILSDK